MGAQGFGPDWINDWSSNSGWVLTVTKSQTLDISQLR